MFITGEELITGVNVSNVEDETGDAGSDQSEAAFISENIQRMLITGSLETCYISINWLKEVRMFLLQSESGDRRVEGGLIVMVNIDTALYCPES